VTHARIPLRWAPRDVPLRARAVVGVGAVARALGRRIAALDDAALRSFAAVAGDDVLVVLGDEESLPWVDGVAYLGRDETAPGLLLPTVLAPTVPAVLLEAAIRRRVARATLVAVLAAPAQLVDCGAARGIDRERVRAWSAAA
jgi:hypothetical protein